MARELKKSAAWDAQSAEDHMGVLVIKVEEEEASAFEEEASMRGSPTQGLEHFRQRFRHFVYLEAEGPRQALSCLRELCQLWLQPEMPSKEQILEQFLTILPGSCRAGVREQHPESGEEVVVLLECLRGSWLSQCRSSPGSWAYPGRVLQRKPSGSCQAHPSPHELQPLSLPRPPRFMKVEDVAPALTPEWTQLDSSWVNFCRDERQDLGGSLISLGGEIQTEVRELPPGEEHAVQEPGEIPCHLSEGIAQIPTCAEAGEQEVFPHPALQLLRQDGQELLQHQQLQDLLLRAHMWPQPLITKFLEL
ncbi:hypothetical protein MC885_021556, partial [Smutsia gigantea]